MSEPGVYDCGCTVLGDDIFILCPTAEKLDKEIEDDQEFEDEMDNHLHMTAFYPQEEN